MGLNLKSDLSKIRTQVASVAGTTPLKPLPTELCSGGMASFSCLGHLVSTLTRGSVAKEKINEFAANDGYIHGAGFLGIFAVMYGAKEVALIDVGLKLKPIPESIVLLFVGAMALHLLLRTHQKNMLIVLFTHATGFVANNALIYITVHSSLYMIIIVEVLLLIILGHYYYKLWIKGKSKKDENPLTMNQEIP